MKKLVILGFVLFCSIKAFAVRPPPSLGTTQILMSETVTNLTATNLTGTTITETSGTFNTGLLLNAGGRLGVGTLTPTVPMHVVGDLKFTSATIVDAYNSSFGAVTAASTATLTWTEVTDRLGEFNSSSFTATMAGFYRVSVDVGASQTAGIGCLALRVNGATVLGGDVCSTGATALATVLTISMDRILNLAANDIVRVDASATTANVTFQKMTLAITRQP